MGQNSFSIINALLSKKSKDVVELIKQSLRSTAFQKIQKMEEVEAQKILVDKRSQK